MSTLSRWALIAAAFAALSAVIVSNVTLASGDYRVALATAVLLALGAIGGAAWVGRNSRVEGAFAALVVLLALCAMLAAVPRRASSA